MIIGFKMSKWNNKYSFLNKHKNSFPLKEIEMAHDSILDLKNMYIFAENLSSKREWERYLMNITDCNAIKNNKLKK